jgi:DNA-binding transcriptional LysR family regulator
MRRDELGDLAAFLAIAQEGSFTRAAAKVGTSQSAISHALRRLEDRLGVRLLTRTTRKVALTQAGDRLLTTLEPAFGEVSAQLAAIAELRDKPSGTVRITAPEHAARTVLWPKLEPVLEVYPDINVEISVTSALSDIVTEQFDAGVRLGEQIAKDMIAVPIGPQLRMAVVATQSYFAARSKPLTPQDLADHRCINFRLPTLGSFYAWEFEKDGRELRVRVEGQLAFDHGPTILAAAQAGFGIAFLLEDYVEPYLADGSLVRVLEDWCQPFAGYHLYYTSRRHHSPAFATLLEALRHRT